ncbi:MAG: methyltransferase domain-containing protein [Candidatus Woesearchaeota archaeon]
MRTTNEGHNAKVARHYDVNQLMFSLFWSRDYLRYGLWDENTRSLVEALTNTDRLVANQLNLTPDDLVLDAGCGVGGSAIYFARNYRSHIVGINICESQLEIARKKVSKAGLEDLIDFKNADFTQTPFGDETFTKMYAIESVYHAEDPQAFTDEAFRVLKPGGTLAVVDRFLVKDDMTPAQKAQYQEFMDGQAVKSIPTFRQFRECIDKSGLISIEFYDKMPEVRKCSKKSSRLTRLNYPLTWALTKTHLLPPEILEHGDSLLAIQKLFDSGVMTYCAYTGRKP